MSGKLKILFLCTGNSCRSQMAEGWARHLKGKVIEPYSAGMVAHGLNPRAVLVMKGDDKVVLQPGQEAGAARAGGRLQKAQVDATAAVAWKEGLFHYDHTDMLTIMRQLSRWYDIEIQYEGNVKDIYFSGQISRKNNLSQVLKMFALTKEVQFEITGKRLTVRSITADARQRDSTQ